MKKLRRFANRHWRLIGLIILGLFGLYWLLLQRLGSLTGGLSLGEAQAATATYGWHGLYHQPLYLALDLLRSIVFRLPGHHGQLLTRLPNALIGAATILSFAGLIKLWHGSRTAILATCLFATSAWVLHVSRLASFDVLYLMALPLLLLGLALAHRYATNPFVYYGNILLWGKLLYVPGLIWLIVPTIFWQRSAIAQGWRHFSHWWQRGLYILAGLVWLPLLSVGLSRAGAWRTWIGLPAHFAPAASLVKQFGGVLVHLFIRGPEYPQLWLARAPILDVFALTLCILGIYFYLRHWRVLRSRLLLVYFILGTALVGLGGPVGLSLLVPLLYVLAATGLAFLVHEWLRVFPLNPLARALGLSLIIAAVTLSCVYNWRAYFVAWPSNSTTQVTFRYHR